MDQEPHESDRDPGAPVGDGPPPFDKTAARARYRALMRSWPMRLMFALTALVILATWAFGVAAAYAPDIKTLPGHDITVGAAACKQCHNAGLNAAPAFNHSYAPTCGFCHMQGPPPASGLGLAHRAPGALRFAPGPGR